MKRLAILAALVLGTISAKAQTVEFVVGSTQRVFVEKTAVTPNTTTFAYLEATYGGGAMLKLFHEQKFWDTPLFLHGEYQTTFDGNHTAIAGPSYTFGIPTGFLSLGAFYRYDFLSRLHGAQASFCYLSAWKWVELYGYNHFWYNGSPCFFGEERLHIRITDHFKVGAILDLTYFGQFGETLYFGIRYDF